MIRRYEYKISGVANGVPWTMDGYVHCDWVLVLREIMVQTFGRLAKDKHLKGPFIINSLHIDNVPMQ